MPNDLRWLAVVPDPVTGLDEPLTGNDGKREWLAPDRKTATALIRPLLPVKARHVAAITSALEFEVRDRQPMLVDEPKSGHGKPNASTRCRICGASTFSPWAKYCNAHRSRGPKANWKRSGSY